MLVKRTKRADALIATGEERVVRSHIARNLLQPVLPAYITYKKKKTRTTMTTDADNMSHKERTQSVFKH